MAYFFFETPILPQEDIPIAEIQSRMNVFQIPELDNQLVETEFPEFTREKQIAIRKFMVSYDSSYFRRVAVPFTPPEIQLIIQRLWKNKVLLQLLNNFLIPVNQRGYSRKYIEGPVSLSIFQGQVVTGEIPFDAMLEQAHPGYNTLYNTIYIYGEHHISTIGHCNRTVQFRWNRDHNVVSARNVQEQNQNTVRFLNFLISLARETPSFFDFFVETSLDQRYQNNQTAVYGPNYGYLYLSLYICFEEIAYWIHHFNPDPNFNYQGDRRLDLNLLVNPTPGMPHTLENFVTLCGNKRLDNDLFTSSIPFEFNMAAKNIIRDIGAVRIPAPNSPHWHFVIREFDNLGRMQIQPPFEMLQMKEAFRECFRREERKNTELDAGGNPIFQKCRLGRFHSIDARKIETGVINPVEIGFGIVYKYILSNNPVDYNFVDPTQHALYLRHIRAVYEMCNIRDFLNNIQAAVPPAFFTLFNPASGPFQTQALGILNFCIQNNPELTRAAANCNQTILNIIFLFLLRQLTEDFIPANHGLGIGINPIAPNLIFNDVITALNPGGRSAGIQSDANSVTCLIVLSGYFFKVYALLMDLYGLLRIFKKYKLKTDCQPNRNYNLIIYTGDAHSKVYRRFMKFYSRQQKIAVDIRANAMMLQPGGPHIAGQYTGRMYPRLFKRVYKNVNEVVPNKQSCVTLDPTEQGIDTRIRPLFQMTDLEVPDTRSLGNIYDSL